MQPRILISGSNGNRETYERAVRSAGGLPLSYYCPPVDLPCEGVILAGGGDLNADLFGQVNCGSMPPDDRRDAIELALVARCLQERRPILGICRGHQVVNVALGGTLIQDLPPELLLFHRPLPGVNDDVLHPIRTQDGSLLQALYGDVPCVNSYHHQAIDRLGDGVTATAWSESGLVEALEHRTAPIVTVQFHPERLSEPRHGTTGLPIFQWFIPLCQDRAMG